MRKHLLSITAAATVILAAPGPGVPAAAQQRVSVSHALALHGDVKYGPGFKNFDYADPNAPKGGAIRLAAVGTFDSLNPFILKGVPAAGVGLLFDTLTLQSDDEPFTEYGLLAERIEVPSDRSWVAYQLRPEAKWHDGSPITSDDVVFSFETLIAKGHPFYKAYYNDVLRVEKQGSRKVRFVFRQGSNPELALIMGQLPVFSKKYYTENAFDKTSLDPPMGSGPYRVSEVKPGRSITFQRVPDYWGRELPVNRGRYNFDTIRYEYYRDETVIVEAFKAGEYDFRLENVAKTWATAYEGSAFNKKLIVKEELPNENPTGMQAFVFNTRRPLFKDRRVRLALSCAFDFEWTNKTFFYGAYTRTRSYFSNSELASSGLPGPEELRLLEPFRKQLPPEVFTQEYDPPRTDGSGNIRENLRTALDLLKQAGWELKGGKLVKEEPGKAPVSFEFEMLFDQPSEERFSIPFKKNLERIGITANIRTVDESQYVNRLEKYDFDMTSTVWAQSLSPGNEQRDFWSSAAADRPGTRNLAGIKDPAVDALVNRVITAPDRAGLVAACRALDRALLWGYYAIPHWHIRTYRLAYWNKFGRPAVKPRYGLGFIDTWWIDGEKEKALGKK
jgi:microcin C transport system substrate-binding protein